MTARDRDTRARSFGLEQAMTMTRCDLVPVTDITPLPEEIALHVQRLLTPPFLSNEGLIAAWLDGNRPAYRYQEASGYLLSLVSLLYAQTGDDLFAQSGRRIVSALSRAVDLRGGCGRDDRVYLFDSAICLQGLSRYLAVFGDSLDAQSKVRLLRTLNQLVATVREMIRERAAVTGEPDRSRWSELFTVHIIKALAQTMPWLDDSADTDVRDYIADAVDRLFYDGLFHPETPGDSIYLHPHCYAVEGLIHLDACEQPRFAEPILQAAIKLAEMQRSSGALPAYWPDADFEVADTTAQAARIWLLCDKERFAENIDRALSCLANWSDERGGIRYSGASTHINSWATIFTVQAMLWRSGNGSGSLLI